MCMLHRSTLCIGSNIFLSVAIVLLNKLVYNITRFPNVTLTFIHFVVTFFGLQICRRANVFVAKQLHIASLIPVALSFCGFVVFTNLSLGHNTVGTYQIMKTLTLPSVMLIQRLFYKQIFPLKIQLTLIPITFGAVLNSAYDIKFNVMGTIFALLGVVITSFYQVWVGEKQKELQADSMQLLLYLAPLSALFLFICLPVLEPPWTQDGLFQHHWSVEDCVLVSLSGIVAFFINVSIYWIIGNTSAVTYNVVGQLKFCLIIVSGCLLFSETVLKIQFIGVLVTFFGVCLYTYFKIQEQARLKLPLISK